MFMPHFLFAMALTVPVVALLAGNKALMSRRAPPRRRGVGNFDPAPPHTGRDRTVVERSS